MAIEGSKAVVDQVAIAAATLPADLSDRLRLLRDALLTGLVERDVAIRLALLAALTGEHLLSCPVDFA